MGGTNGVRRIRFRLSLILLIVFCIAAVLTAYRVGNRQGFKAGSTAGPTGEANPASLTATVPNDEDSRRRTRASLQRRQEPYAHATSLHDAVEVLRHELVRDDLDRFSTLVTEQLVREAIPKALQEYEAGYEHALEENDEQQRKRLQQHLRNLNRSVKPALIEITESGEWPPGSFFQYWGGNGSSTFRIYIHVMHDNPSFSSEFHAGFALPIIQVETGRAD